MLLRSMEEVKLEPKSPISLYSRSSSALSSDTSTLAPDDDNNTTTDSTTTVTSISSSTYLAAHLKNNNTTNHHQHLTAYLNSVYPDSTTISSNNNNNWSTTFVSTTNSEHNHLANNNNNSHCNTITGSCKDNNSNNIKNNCNNPIDNNNNNNNINNNENKKIIKNNNKIKYLRGSYSESIKNSIKGLVNGTSLFVPPIVKRLLRLKIESIEEKWNEQAVKGLVRRLKKNLDSLEELEKSLVEKNPNTKCVTIVRSLDGRLQVSERKGLPHVIYCQLWRWPDLQSHHQIKGIESCSYSFQLKLKLVCVNPYHYERVGDPPLPAIMVPRNTADIPHDIAQSYEEFSHSLGDNLETVSMDIFNDQLMSSDVGVPSDLNINEVLDQHQSFDKSSSSMYYPPVQYIENTQPITYTEAPCWASINYYELAHRIGEKFDASQPFIVVDGYTDPSRIDRFCLGNISNINREPIAEHVRKHIGRGVKLSYVGGEVFVECLSSASVFVQSINCNQRYGWHPGSVCKVPPGSSLKIFNNQEFASLLERSVKGTYESVFALTHMCAIRLSFVKGWGAEYRRRDILSIPCWIEIQLNGPLQWLDRVLRQMGPPAGHCSSMS